MLRNALGLTEKGMSNFKRGVFFCGVANLVLMAPMAVLFLLVYDFLNHYLKGAPLPDLGLYLIAIVVIVALIALTQWLEYRNTYGPVYEESARKREGIAERLRKLPLSFFGRRDLSDLTNTIMKDCADQERMFMHVVPQLFGTGISTLVIVAGILASELATGTTISSAQAFLKLGIASTILVGAYLIVAEQIDFMTYFAFLLIVTRVYDPINVVLQSSVELMEMRHSIKRTNALAAEPIMTGKDEFTPQGHDIVFDEVSFSYNSGEQVLDRVSFVAKEGEVTALVGPSGSGKSTIAKLAARFWDADSGTVSLGGVDVSTVDPEILLTDYAQVFQDVVLFDETIMDNIRLGREGATDKEVLAVAKAANCDEFVDRMPKGYFTYIGENGVRLSGGERQRISIARALLKNAPIVLLDEATASLDVENESQVQRALSYLLQGKTVMVIAHRMRTVLNADKIVVLKDGRVVEQGSPSDLLKKENGLFRHMVELQGASAEWTV